MTEATENPMVQGLTGTSRCRSEASICSEGGLPLPGSRMGLGLTSSTSTTVGIAEAYAPLSMASSMAR
ncbi:unnamed protein product [Pseudo-nitzschia multistriata]|uniref:Uncharacterized protein n=1 Tax=Pseudo-nitzschia multistriata TaxID=183589 RepID=A0A448YW72_9STRA|nr:unnamed protein product [Pseudo-nitzschia multistriata]